MRLDWEMRRLLCAQNTAEREFSVTTGLGECFPLIGRWNNFIRPVSSVVRYKLLPSFAQRIAAGLRSQSSVKYVYS